MTVQPKKKNLQAFRNDDDGIRCNVSVVVISDAGA